MYVDFNDFEDMTFLDVIDKKTAYITKTFWNCLLHNK